MSGVRGFELGLEPLEGGGAALGGAVLTKFVELTLQLLYCTLVFGDEGFELLYALGGQFAEVDAVLCGLFSCETCLWGCSR